MAFLDEFLKYKRIIILKARQLGISWLVAGYSLWKILGSENALVLLLSQNEAAAISLQEKCKFIYDHLPSFLQRPVKHPDSREILDFKDSYSRIETLPSTDRAGKGTDATLAIRDELAEHDFGSANYLSIMPTIDAGGGQSIDLSTIKKADLENHFTERVLKAYTGAVGEIILPHHGRSFERYTGSGATLLFAGWRLRPVRQDGITLDEWWKREIIPSYEPFEIEENYPATIDEALSAPKITCRFDTASIDGMKKMSQPILREEFNGLVRIYKESEAGSKYTLVVDPSEGSEDPSAGIVAEFRSRAKVADFRGKISLNEQAMISHWLSEKYNQPYTAVERNAQGILLIDKLFQMGISNWYYCDKSRDKAGWWTNSVNRPVMIADLAEDIRLKAFYEPSGDALNQFLSFIRTKKKPDGEARRGTHDEFVICWAIEGQIRKYIPTGTAKIKSFKYKESW